MRTTKGSAKAEYVSTNGAILGDVATTDGEPFMDPSSFWETGPTRLLIGLQHFALLVFFANCFTLLFFCALGTIALYFVIGGGTDYV